ncbi:MAG: rod shape-determining protein MreC [Chloroflexota bacterium]
MGIGRGRTLPIILIGFLLIIGIGLDQLGYMTAIRTVIQTVTLPAQEPLSLAASNVSDLTQSQPDLTQLQEENTLLRAELNRLLVENVQLRELETENRQLRELLNYTRNNPSLKYETAQVKARVIGTDLNNLLYTVFIDVGARDGVASDMPVVTHRGLVGRVAHVNPNTAQVVLLIDPTSSVNAITQNSRVEGLISGQLNGTLVLERIPQGEIISPGDLILTSGLGNKFPGKLVIGQVTEVIQQDLELFQTARVRSTVDFGELDTVLVLTSFQTDPLELDTLQSQEGLNN